MKRLILLSIAFLFIVGAGGANQVANNSTPIKIKVWLITHGHNQEKVNQLKFENRKDIIKSMVELHGMTEEQYRKSR